MDIKVKYLRDVPDLRYQSVGDWIDLCAGEDIHLTKGEATIIPLGVAMQLPEGYEAIIAPRSSLFKRYGIIQTNGIGVIDNSYNGDTDEWGYPVLCMADSTFIPKGTRICQFRLVMNQPSLSFTEVDSLGNKARGGFGSTGV